LLYLAAFVLAAAALIIGGGAIAAIIIGIMTLWDNHQDRKWDEANARKFDAQIRALDYNPE
jgi:hypothetical protein